MRFFAGFGRWYSTKRKPSPKTASRRLSIEPLEQRALLSAASLLPSGTTQQMTLADLPAVAQQSIAAQIGQQAKLSISDSTPDDQGFGTSVAMSGNTIVVGAPQATVGVNQDQGAVYVFVKSGPNWTNMTQVAKLTSSDGQAGDDFGGRVAISGNTIVIGAYSAAVGVVADEGAAYVFTEPASGWTDMTQTAKLNAPFVAPAGANFGISIAISGNTIAVGDFGFGMAFVYVKPASGWTNTSQAAELTASDDAGVNGGFGNSVSISGNTIAVGAADLGASPSNEKQGAVYVFNEPPTGWANMTQSATLTASNGAPGDDFGVAVVISGNTIVARDATSTATYLFTEQAHGWANETQTAMLTPSDGLASVNGGGVPLAVAISGNTVVEAGQFQPAGGGSAVAGAAYVFTEPVSGWTNMSQTAKLTASGGAGYSGFGPLAISGGMVVASVGFNNDDPSSVLGYAAPASGWSNMTQTAAFTAARTASDGAPADRFGQSIAISSNMLVVGAPGITVGSNVSQGAAYVFEGSGSNWIEIATLTASDGGSGGGFGGAVAIDGNTIVVSGNYRTNNLVYWGDSEAEAAYVFVEPASGWTNMTQAAMLTPSGGLWDAEYGISVAVSGNTVVVGAGPPTVNGPMSGVAQPTGSNEVTGAYVYTEAASGWTNMTQTAKLTPANSFAYSDFATSVAISGNTIVIGGDGAAHVFTRPLSGWANMSQGLLLTPSDGAPRENFGKSVAISGNTIVVGAPQGSSSPPTSLLQLGLNLPLSSVGGSNGALYVYTEPFAGWTSMTQTAKLTASASMGYQIGNQVAIGGSTIVTAAGGNSELAFTEPAGGWSNMTPTAILKASDTVPSNDFNFVVTNGGTIVVGLPDANVGQGGAYVFSIAGNPGATPANVTAVSTTAAPGVYAAKSTVPIQVTFSGPVTVTGTPQLALSAGSGATAVYSGGSGTATLTFTYTVAAGQFAADLDYASTTALTLAGGTIANSSGLAATRTLPNTGTDGLAAKKIAVDAAPPMIVSSPVKSAGAGQKYAYQVKVSASAGQIVHYSLGASPLGMTISPATGQIAWLPPATPVGAITVTVLATDQFGQTGQQTFVLSVLGGLPISSPYGPPSPVANYAAVDQVFAGISKQWP
jgi:hypothetical protein